ncbi:DUF5994 family protein [Nocardia sp. NBC_01329]|uniref:DUF5994 family protein n=1 Tax=Nocardia sp. NBC_01329 TaxID=2903594 RepID=UPI002E1245FE|nr:DUF5994 family protein [Nocardia sp. NBC_01329]
MTDDPQGTSGGRAPERGDGHPRTPADGSQPFAAPTRTPRLVLGDPAAPTGSLDGAWWPRTDNLTTELHDLITALTTRLGATTRIAFDWNRLSLSQRGIDPSDGIEVTGPLPDQPLEVMYVFGAHNRRIRILVIPPATPADAAETQMRTAVSGAADHPKA